MVSSIGSTGVSAAYGQRPPAPPEPPSPEEMFQRLDSDGNGVLDTSELEEMAAKHTEMTGEETTVADLLQMLDADGSGTLEVSEIPEPPAHEFRGPPPFLAEDGTVAESTEGMKGFNPLDSLMSYIQNDENEEESSSLLDLQV